MHCNLIDWYKLLQEAYGTTTSRKKIAYRIGNYNINSTVDINAKTHFRKNKDRTHENSSQLLESALDSTRDTQDLENDNTVELILESS